MSTVKLGQIMERTAQQQEEEFVASYNTKDLILYALSVGFGSDAKADELKYLYENHPEFTAVPTFCLALSFWAVATINHQSYGGTSCDIPPFPPPTMSATTTIPKEHLRSNLVDMASSNKYPILHIYQSIQWHCDLPIPKSPPVPHLHNKTGGKIRTRLGGKIVSIEPKSIGTFVKSETSIREESSGSPLCTLQSTALVLGIPKRAVIPMDAQASRDVKSSTPITIHNLPHDSLRKKKTPDFEWAYETSPTQSLLYRLASGDSNRIHVTGDKAMAQQLGLTGQAQQRPILHGLCTLGIAARAILQFASQNDPSPSLARLEGHFSKPVYIGDRLVVKLWEILTRKLPSDTTRNTARDIICRTIEFVVFNSTTNETVLDKGVAEVIQRRRIAAGLWSKL